MRLPFRRQSPVVRDIKQQQVKEMLRDEVIRPSTSPWASPVVMVKKKDGSMRFCVDFCKVNDATIKDAHPLPRRQHSRVFEWLPVLHDFGLKVGVLASSHKGGG